MPLNTNDINIRYSNPLAERGNSLPQNIPYLSLGKYVSTTNFLDNNNIHNLFPPLTGENNRLKRKEHLCLFICNLHLSLTFYNVKVWINQQANTAEIRVGRDTVGLTELDSVAQQAIVIPEIYTPPPGVIFTQPVTYDDALPLGNIPPQTCLAIWIQRIPLGNFISAQDLAEIKIVGDTV